jgi:hypothetical protein
MAHPKSRSFFCAPQAASREIMAVMAAASRIRFMSGILSEKASLSVYWNN